MSANVDKPRAQSTPSDEREPAGSVTSGSKSVIMGGSTLAQGDNLSSHADLESTNTNLSGTDPTLAFAGFRNRVQQAISTAGSGGAVQALDVVSQSATEVFEYMTRLIDSQCSPVAILVASVYLTLMGQQYPWLNWLAEETVKAYCSAALDAMIENENVTLISATQVLESLRTGSSDGLCGRSVRLGVELLGDIRSFYLELPPDQDAFALAEERLRSASAGEARSRAASHPQTVSAAKTWEAFRESVRLRIAESTSDPSKLALWYQEPVKPLFDDNAGQSVDPVDPLGMVVERVAIALDSVTRRRSMP